MARSKHPVSRLLDRWHDKDKALKEIEQFFSENAETLSDNDAVLYAKAARLMLQRCIRDLSRVRYEEMPAYDSEGAATKGGQ